jgi:hypothetical protein
MDPLAGAAAVGDDADQPRWRAFGSASAGHAAVSGLVEPDAGNGLHKRSQVMVDKVQTVPREKVGETFGRWTIRRCWRSLGHWPSSWDRLTRGPSSAGQLGSR